MPAIAFLSTDHLEDFFVYDELLVPYFNERGWSVETISWHSQSEKWDRFDYVIVRSTWDYQQHPRAFALARREQPNINLLITALRDSIVIGSS